MARFKYRIRERLHQARLSKSESRTGSTSTTRKDNATLVNQDTRKAPTFHETDPLRSAAFGLLLALCVLLPFELKNPLFQVGPIGITSVEIAAYLAIGAWAACRLTGRCRGWTLAHATVAVWGAVLVCSALLAPGDKPEALKFALRSLGGCALCWAVADIVRRPGQAASIGLALLAGASVSAAAARAEAWWPGVAAALQSFKTGPTLSGSFLRAGGTFQYANIASMYWEAALPLALAVPAWLGRRQAARRWLWIGTSGFFLLTEAILLAASRAGIMIAVLIAVLSVVASRGSLARLKPFAVAGLVAAFLLTGVHAATDRLLVLRLSTSDVSSWYRAIYSEFPDRLAIPAGKTTRVPLYIRNAGRLTWRSRGTEAAVVSYHWLDPSAGRVLTWDGARSEIPSDVAPGDGVRMEPWIIAPAEPGSYMLQWDMLQEGIAWFSTFGPSRAQMDVQVLPPAVSGGALSKFPSVDLPLPAQPARLDLWLAAIRMWLEQPVSGVGPDNFRRLYGPYLGLQSFDDRVYANNLYLEVLADSGLVGLAAWLAVLAGVAIGIRQSWRSAHFPEDRLLTAGIGIALAAYCLHGMVDYFQAFTPTYGQFWILAGTVLGLARGDDTR